MANQQVNRDFLFRRLHSLLGVVPITLFLFIHLFTNSFATKGAEAFNDKVGILESIPFLPIVEFVFIFLPLLYHGVYGMYVAYTSGYNASKYSWGRNLMFTLQRTSGVITFIFIIYHLWTTRFSGDNPSFDMVASIVSSPLQYWFMIIGTVMAVFHLANGLWGFFIHWGVTVGPRAQRVSAYALMGLFVVLSGMGVAALMAFHG
ncbi:succinate dehydrogenase cytochrome b558 subunit [Tumebacillus permanentifrigoris]|uniref:Succinate dehydrogenase subunit C n=1 Tax=Tumebacillus permanentifrigoris TaxID=378543 RepID=A0A316DCI7_9BACL|nr:succinate dehydrogenase cytochrome b558 subunit [Tumebacillus permanentifrigoris]PWK15867.1 succinate dehydrogenase subunit C [Tumebacillus permanentifrigoris]